MTPVWQVYRRRPYQRVAEDIEQLILEDAYPAVYRPTVKPISEALLGFLCHSADGISVIQLFEVRQPIEPNCARLAAQRATNDELQVLWATLQALENGFHLGTAAATDNLRYAKVDSAPEREL